MKVGDKVVCIDDSASFGRLLKGNQYLVEAAYDGTPTVIVNGAYHCLERFIPLQSSPDNQMSTSLWQPIDTCPMDEPVLVAFHGHGENRVKEVQRTRNTGKWPEFYWGDFDYINSHDGEPKYWMPLPTPPDDMAGPHCGCDGCTERYCDPESPDYIPDQP